MKKLYISIVALFFTYGALAQVPTMQWGLKIGGTLGDLIQTTCADQSGNIYIGGSFKGTFDFDPGAGTASRTANGSGTDAFIARFTPAGVFQWVVTFGGTLDDTVNGLAADGTSVYATGYFQGSANFNPFGASTAPTAYGGKDIFVAKYAALSGNLSFVRSFGSSSEDIGNSVAIDPSSNIYVTGSFQDVVDFDPSTGTDNEQVWGGIDMFLAKYTNSGAYVWANDLGSVADDDGKAVYATANEVWVAGYYNARFYADPNNYGVYIDILGGQDGYFGKYDASTGAALWGGFIRSTQNETVTTIAYDAATNSVYTGGHFSSTATMFGDVGTNQSVTSKGFTDCFLARHDAADMKLKWINSFGGAQTEYLAWLVADGANVSAVGVYQATMDVDPSAAGTTNLTNVSGNYDAFYTKYHYLTGAYVTSFSLGGTASDEFTSAVFSGGYFYPVGVFTGTLDIDPGGAVNSNISAGDYDGFFGKFAPGEPAASAQLLSFNNVGTTTFNVSFAPTGYPDGYVTVFKTASAPTGIPVDGVTYTAGGTIGDATVLYVGPQPAFNVVSASPSTQYFITVYPYNGSGTTTNYKTTAPLSSSVTTATPAAEPAASPTWLTPDNITKTSYTVNFTAAAGTPAGYIAVRATGSAPTTDPVDGVTYAAGGVLGNGTVAFIGGLNATAGTTVLFPETGLSPGTQYFYKIYSFNGTGGTINYRQTSPAAGDVTTTNVAAEPTAQPTNLVFSSVKSTSFAFTFDASTSANLTGYLGVRSTGSPTTFVPEDGVTYNVGDYTNGGVNDERIELVSENLLYHYSDGDLSASTTYYFTIYAYNGSGDQVNYLQTAPLSKSQTTPATDPITDSTSPTIVDNTAASAPANTAVKVTATITDTGSGVASASVEYYPVNGSEYDEMDMTLKSGNTWEATIPASFNTAQGVEYRIHATDEVGNSAASPLWKTVAAEFTGDGMTIPYAAGSAKENYRIISVPLNLAKKSVTDVFADDLGEYKKSKYRLFRFSGGQTTELSASSSIEVGKGYWFIATESKTVDSGAGTTSPAGLDTPITIPITNGWNQIGNPFNFDVNWSVVAGHPDNVDKQIGAFKTYNGQFATATQLKKMSGGFVMIQTAGDGKLRIPVFDESGRAGAPELLANFQQALTSDTWAVDIQMKSGSYENTFAGFGMHPKASEQNDVFDDFTLPRFMDYLELNYNKKLFGSSFTKDIVPTSTQHVWEFNVESNIDNDIIELRWDNSYFGNTGQQLMLWDVEQQLAIDMKTENMYAFERGRSGAFKIFFGSETFVKEETKPYIPVFHSASPVPSSGNVTFAFSVPESRGEVKTSLVIYNMMGQKVANLLDGSLPAGYQQAVWNVEDGTKPAAGMYISILKFGDTTLQKRLIIR